MSRIGASVLLTLCIAAAGPALAQNIWSCKDPSGRTHVTNLKEDTIGKDCRVVQQERVTVVPAAKTKTPASFPRETPGDRLTARAKQKDTIEKELNQEESMLADARKKLSEQEAIRTGDEKNYAKVLERLKPYKDTVEVHEKNVEALKRELVNLSR